jgi:hypothetical protein
LKTISATKKEKYPWARAALLVEVDTAEQPLQAQTSSLHVSNNWLTLSSL